MRILTLVFLSSVLALPGPGAIDGTAEKVTVAQLENVVAAVRGQPDAVAAQRLIGIELTERLDSARLAKLRGNLSGEKAWQALAILADQSAFLGVPGADIPQKPTPDRAAQRQMMATVVAYVTKNLHQLPNFLATRHTRLFEDRPQSTSLSYAPLHLVGQSSVAVVYRDGQEMVDTAAAKGKKRVQLSQGLASWGEFGPILSTVLLDAAQSTLAWSHWETSAQGPVAVFRYKVPAKSSHYQVQFCCVADTLVGSNPADPLESRVFRQRIGYHGEIAAGAQDGSILRLTVEAELAPGDPLTTAALMVEYGVVEIGGKNFICPISSVTLAQKHEVQPSIGPHFAAPLDRSPLKTLLNHVAFEQYRRFGSEVHILTADNQGSGGNRADSEPAETTPSELQPLSSASAESPAARENIPSSGAVPARETAAAPPPEITHEITVEAANGFPDDAAFPDDKTGIPLRATAHPVDIGVVVYDQTGHPLRGLRQADFAVYDNGHEQAISSFGQISAQKSGVPDSTAAAPGHAGVPSLASEPAATILLIDESHILPGDLKTVREQILKFLVATSSGARVGLYAIGDGNFQVLAEVSTDRAALIERLRNWTPTKRTNSPPSASDMHPAHASIEILAGIAQHLAALPGHKNLVWLSSDTVFVDTNDTQTASGKDGGYKQLDDSTTRTLEAMNDANVALIPFDVSRSGRTQLPGGAIGADDYAPSKDPFAQIQTSQAIGLPIQWPIRELAKSTGGLTIQHSSSVAKALSQIVADSGATYLMSFSPDAPGDGQYHAISINLMAKSGYTLRYRTGYRSIKEPATSKGRFQQAIWQSADVGGIKVTVTVANGQLAAAGLKINIAASDLALRRDDGRWRDKIDIFFIQRNDASLHAEVEGQTLTLRLTASTYEQMLAKGVPFEHPLKLGPGVSSLRVLVVDENSARMGSFTIPAQALGGGS